MITLTAADGTRLALHDLGGTGSPALLLPGLCGNAREWAATASWLTGTHHVHALDPRGHGASERRPADVSRAAHVADAVLALEEIGPAVVIGQSLGGHTAFLVAAARPDLVNRLVLAEAGPAGPDGDTAAGIDRWLSGWPVPFPDLATAAEYLGGGLAGAAWAAGLEVHDDGLRPAFDSDVMVATIAAASGPRWTEFASVSCPMLLVRGEKGFLDAAEFERMATHPLASAVTFPGGGHDVHLDSPELWQLAVREFLLV
ncbi:alpha/beta fold hydrolase [Longispora albida]|uniref:alpha/beta fold hydrolase n=1 Tax=Longispora albida TaxID=203523 RepID=UPI00036E29F4|nr:alpha/beta hydrolase [Longispora albida]